MTGRIMKMKLQVLKDLVECKAEVEKNYANFRG